MELHSIIDDIERMKNSLLLSSSLPLPSSSSSSLPSSSLPSLPSSSSSPPSSSSRPSIVMNKTYNNIFNNEKYKHCCPNCPSNANNWYDFQKKKLIEAVNLSLQQSSSSSSISPPTSETAVAAAAVLSLSSSSSSSNNNATTTNNNNKIDWNQIAKVDDINHSPFECMMQFRNNDDVTINKSPWSLIEESRLKDLAEKYDQCYWVDIADDLGTHRTPWDCLTHYQQLLNNKLVNTSEWTDEEDLKLKNAIQEYGLKNWNNVANCIPGRSSAQCTYRWRISMECHDNLVAGYWTEEENRKMFLAAISYQLPLSIDACKTRAEIDEFLRSRESNSTASNINLNDDIHSDDEKSNNDINNEADDAVELIKPKRKSRRKNLNEDIEKKEINWVDLALVVGTKDPSRCRERWVNHLDPTINFDPFTKEEDEQLMKLVKIFGVGNWAKIAKWMPGRTDRKLMLRWKRLDEITAVKAFKENNKKKRQKVITPKLNRNSTDSKLKESDIVAVLKLKSNDSTLSFSKVL